MEEGGKNSRIPRVTTKMKKVVSSVNKQLENIFEKRKTYEKELKAMDTELKEYNKQMRQINKDLKTVEKNSKEAKKLKEKKEEVFHFQEVLKKKKEEKKETYIEEHKKEMEEISRFVENAPEDDHEEIQCLKDVLVASHEDEKNSLLEVQNKIEGLEKLNRAEMPENFRERIQIQIKQLTKNKEKIQTSFAQRRETIQLKIEEARTELATQDDAKEIIEEIVQSIQEEDWKQAQKLWKPYKKELEKTKEEVESMNEIEEFENVMHTNEEKENVATLVGNVQTIEEKVEEIAEVKVEKEEAVQEIAEEKVEEVPSNPEKIHSVFIDMVTETIYADKGQNEGKDYNVEIEMLPSMLKKDAMLATIRKHVPNFDRIVTEKEAGEMSEKSEEDYNRYMEIFSKVDPLMITVLDGSHEDFRQYLKAVKNQKQEEMPCEVYYNLSKITKTEFTEMEQDEIIDNVEKNAGLAIQIKGLKSAKRARSWRKFENQHAALRAVMRWLRMEENVQQLTEGK